MEVIQPCLSRAFRPCVHLPYLPPKPNRFRRIPFRMLASFSNSALNPLLSLRHGLLPSATQSSTSDPMAAENVENDISLVIKKRALEISPDLRGTSIFLVGINSSYKSSVGRILSDALRYYYFDSDCLVEEAAGGRASAISNIEKDEGEYLASETEVLKQLSSMGRLVVCAGNGAVKSTENLALLRHGISIWIDVPLDLVAQEVAEDKVQFSALDMPTCRLSSEVQAQVTALYNSAKSGYSTADTTVSLQKIASKLGYYDLDAVTAEDLCLEVLKEIESLVRVKKMMEEAGRPF